MALDSSSVANSIISEVLARQGLDSSGNIIASNLVTFLSKREINTIIASKISTYLSDNLKVKCSYTGAIPGGSSDPNNGTFYLKTQSVPLTGESIELKSDYSSQQASSGTPKNDWMAGIVLSLKGSIFKVTNGTITVTCPTPTFLISMEVPDLPTTDNFKNNISSLVSVLFDKIENGTKPVPTPLPSTSISGGIGTSTLLTFE